MSDADKKLFNEEAEIAVIGGLMVSPVEFDDARGLISSEDFVDIRHQAIWKAMIAVADAKHPIDPVTVMDRLSLEGMLPYPVDVVYLASLADTAPSAANVIHYAKIVANYRKRRQLDGLGSRIKQWVYESLSPLEISQKIMEAISKIDGLSPDSGPRLVGSILAETIDEMYSQSQRTTALLGLSTGLIDLDKSLDGLKPGALYIVAARPAMGKTQLALQFAREAMRDDRQVAFFSLEMPERQLGKRLLASETQIDYSKIRSATLAPNEWTALCDATTALSDALLWIDETPGLELAEFMRRARSLHRSKPLSLIVVDYIGLMRNPLRNGNREQEIAAISRSFKEIAKELSVPVVALAQLNREVESRTDKRPQLSDLRESGSLEQDADVVMMLYRDEVYHPNTVDRGCAEILVRKQRDGETGTIATIFDGAHCRFKSLAGGLPSVTGGASSSQVWP